MAVLAEHSFAFAFARQWHGKHTYSLIIVAFLVGDTVRVAVCQWHSRSLCIAARRDDLCKTHEQSLFTQLIWLATLIAHYSRSDWRWPVQLPPIVRCTRHSARGASLLCTTPYTIEFHGGRP